MVTLQEMNFEVQRTGNSRLEVKLQNKNTKDIGSVTCFSGYF